MSTIGRVLYAMRHQSFMQVWLVVVLLGSWVRLSSAQETLTKLLIAHAGLISTHASVWLAEDQGFYKKHGLDATSVFTGSGSVTSQALIAGEAKVASTSVGPTAAAVGGGADLMIVAGTIHIMPYQFWVLPQVRQAADLERKKSRHQHLWLGELIWRLKWLCKFLVWSQFATRSLFYRWELRRNEWRRF